MILDRFPCRIGTPNQKVCHTPEEAFRRINAHNGATDVYATLYNGNNVIGKAVWDFDIEEDQDDKYGEWGEALADFRRLSERLAEENYQQMSVFSGGGLHKYLKTTEYTLDRPRNALRAVQRKFQDELDLKTDEQIFGDTERIFRVPNTYHPSRQRYCIPLEHDEIYQEIDELIELAQEQRYDVDPIVGEEEYPIHKHDEATGMHSSLDVGSKIEGNFNPAEVEPEDVIFPIYPCIANLLKNYDEVECKGHGLGFRRRFLVILHLRETGHEYQECVQILKNYLSTEEFRHCVRKERQPQQIYQRKDLLFPDCERLQAEIPCIHHPEEDDPCTDRNTLYY